jgi:hypothetical protein
MSMRRRAAPDVKESPMSFAEHIAPIFRAAMEILRDEGRPLKPAEVREAVAARVTGHHLRSIPST